MHLLLGFCKVHLHHKPDGRAPPVIMYSQEAGINVNTYSVNHHFESQRSLISFMLFPLSRYSCLSTGSPWQVRPFTKYLKASVKDRSWSWHCVTNDWMPVICLRSDTELQQNNMCTLVFGTFPGQTGHIGCRSWPWRGCLLPSFAESSLNSDITCEYWCSQT